MRLKLQKNTQNFKKHLKFFKKIDREYFPYYNSQKKCIYFWSDAMADKDLKRLGRAELIDIIIEL